MSIEERVKSEARATKRITNNDLVCKDCIYKFYHPNKPEKTAKCEAYKSKPSSILLGGNCPYRRAENE